MYTRTDEAEAITAVAADYYHGMVDADGDKLRTVFHPDANIIGNFGGKLEFSNLEDFIAGTKHAKSGDQPFEYRVDALTITGDTAVITVGGYCYATWFTDNLSMLKIGDTWKIVAKIFYPHPQNPA